MLSTVIERKFYNCALLFCRRNIKKPGARRTLFQAWWRRVDSNHRSETQQIYSLPPLATRELLHMQLSGPPAAVGAGGRIRTPDLLITNQLLYRLSYTSTWRLSNSRRNYSKERKRCQVEFQKNFISPLWDLQDQRPDWYCARCGGEQYHYDRAWQGRGGRLCARCFAQEKLRRDHYDVS